MRSKGWSFSGDKTHLVGVVSLLKGHKTDCLASFAGSFLVSRIADVQSTGRLKHTSVASRFMCGTALAIYALRLQIPLASLYRSLLTLHPSNPREPRPWRPTSCLPLPSRPPRRRRRPPPQAWL